MKFIKNNIHLITFYLLLIAPIVVTVISLFFLPEQVPMHSDINGNVDRYGSKFEILIVPLSNTIFGAIFFLLAKKSSRTSELSLIWGANVAMATFNIINYVLIASGFSSSKSILPEMGQFLFAIVGMILVILGLFTIYIKKRNMNKISKKLQIAINLIIFFNLIFGLILIIVNIIDLKIKVANVISICILCVNIIASISTFIVAKTIDKNKGENNGCYKKH